VTRVFHAHSTPNPDESGWQTLSDHLNAVGQLAAQSAKHFGTSKLAETAGKLRDIGKYTDSYQKRVRGGPRVGQATWGMKIAYDQYGPLGRVMAYASAEPKYGTQFMQLIAMNLHSDRHGLQLGESALLDAARFIY
jgi:CRISPR-associated endonuclease/helicase Cas3